MANEKISDLPSGSPALPGDEIPIARANSNFRLAAQDIANLADGVNLSIGGNTLGVPVLLSSGTAVLAGGNNITLSQNAGSITIIGGAGGGGGNNFSLGVSNIGNTSGNTGVTGTQLVLAGDNNITLNQFTSPSGATISISAFNQSVQTQGIQAASFGGNTAGVAGAVTSGTLFLAGGNNVTLSQNGNSISISAGTAAAAVLSVSAGSTSGAFGGLTFSNGSGVSWGLNNGTITASAVQSVQTQASGNIGGTGFATTTQAGALIAGTNNTAGFTLGVPAFLTTQTNQTQNNVAAVVIGGNTAGATASVSSGTMVLNGGNNITLSQAGNSVTVSAAAQSAQTLGLYAISQTTGQSSFSSADARSLSFVGAGAVSVGVSNGSYVISGATAVPPSTAGINVAGNTTGQSFFSTYQQSSAVFSGAGIISLGWSSNSFIISAPGSTGISQSMFAASNTTLGTSGTQSIGSLVLAGAGNVSVGVSNGSYVISGATAAGGGGVNFGVSTGGNTAGATGTVSTGNVVLVGSGPISLSQATGGAGSAATITINAPAISSISGTGGLSVSANASTISLGIQPPSWFAFGNTTQNSSTTFDNRSINVSGSNGVSVGFSAGSLIIAGATNGAAQTGISSIAVSNTTFTNGLVSFVNANGISFGSSGASGISASYTVPTQSVQTQASGNIGATGFATTTIAGSVIAGTNNTAGFTLAVPPYLTAQSVQTQASGNIGATGFATTTAAGSVIAGTHNTVGFTLGVPAFITAQSNQTLGAFAVGNTTNASSGTIDARSLSISGLGGVTVGISGSNIQVSGPAISSISGTGLLSVSVNASTISLGVPGTTQSVFVPYWGSQTPVQIGNGSIQVYPANMDRAFSASRADILASISGSTVALSSYAGTVSAFVGIYTRNGSTLSLASSGSQSFSFSNQSGVTNLTAFNGVRNLSVPINVNGSPQDAWLAVMTQTASANTNAWTASNMMIPGNGVSLAGLIGASANATQQQVLGLGVFSVSSAVLPSSMAFSGINGTASGVQMMPAIAFHNVSA
jgi:collagen type VII alpha